MFGQLEVAYDTRQGSNTIPVEFKSKPPVLRVHLFGPLHVTSYLGDNMTPQGRKARAAFGYLCCHAGQRVPRSRLASLLWDRVPDRQARASLRQCLRELSETLEPLTEELLSIDGDFIKLETRGCWIDALAVLSSQPMLVDRIQADLASLCAGELLEDLSGVSQAFDEWLLAERARITSKLQRRLENELMQLCRPEGDPRRRAELAWRVIELDATHEGASRILMQALADMGERAHAMREYERCRAALKSILDIEPSPETRALYQALKASFSTLSVSTTPRTPEQHVTSTPFWPIDPLQKPAAISGRLRVGILPFQGGDGTQPEGLAFSISQEIALGLARCRWFDVIAPVSLRRRSPVNRRANALHDSLERKQLHYIVDGTLEARGDELHVNVRLLDLDRMACPVWSDHFELTINDLGQLNERVVAPIVARVDPVILFIEGQPSRPPRSGATSLVLQALPLMYSLERERYEEAGRLLHRAIEADPENAKAMAWTAYWYALSIGQGWTENSPQACAKVQDLALRAVKIDPENAEALGIYAHFCAILDKDFDSAVRYFDLALRLNPNLAFIWAISAPTYCYIGQPDRALKHLGRYRDLAPFDPHFQFWEGSYTIAYLFKGDYKKAVEVGLRAVQGNPGFSADYKPLIAALGHLGRRDEAAPYIQKLVSLEPTFTVEEFGKFYPFQRDEDRQRYMRGLELAGVPLA